MTSVRPHVPEEELHAFRDGELSSSQRAEIAEHLLGCLLCRALDAEVEELRSRTTVLLSRAVPRSTRRPATGRRTVAGWGGAVAALLVAAVGGAAWLALPHGPAQSPRLATAAFVTPGLFADVPAISSPAQVSDARRSLRLATQVRLRPRVVGPALIQVSHAAFGAQPVDGIDPAGGADWEQASLDDAMQANRGSLSRLVGLPVIRVQVRRGNAGERPTVLVRQRTADGQPLWVVEGPVEELTSLTQMFEASGLAMSIPQRTRPDYVGSDANPIRRDRMIAVAAYLPVDSLDALVGRLTRE